jgi:hypothetical protein
MLIILAKTNGPSPPPSLGLFFASLIEQEEVSPVLLAAEERGEQLKHLTGFSLAGVCVGGIVYLSFG